jgi:hypothetical protein
MLSDRSSWEAWARNLQRWGLREFVAAFLDAAGPMTILLAQVIYFGQPLVRGMAPGDGMQALARLLDSPGESRSFATFLREERTT